MDISDKLTNLKNQLLDLAIRGKLVEQRPEEGTAEELYAQIQEEKNKLIAEGKIKKEKPLPEITDDEMPFDIPESWKWVALGNICEKLSDGIHYAPNYTKKGIPCFSAKDIYDSMIHFDCCNYISEDDYLLMKDKINVKCNSILITKSGSIGRSAIISEYFNFGLVESIGVVNPILVFSEYLKLLLDYLFFTGKNDEYTRGLGLKHLTLNLLGSIKVPLPPLAEQKRIVDKLKSYLAVIDKAEGLIEKKANIDEEIRNKILDLAIRGKLVEQRPEEGTAEELYAQIQEEKKKLIAEGKIKKEKPLPEITDDEIPFEIPESWKWVYIGNIIELVSGRDLTLHDISSVPSGFPYLTGASQITPEEIIINRWTTNPAVISQLNDILLTCKGTVGKIIINNIGEIHIARQIMALRNRSVCIHNKYLKLFLEDVVSYLISKANGLIPGISREDILYLKFPLPPLAEQKRIVAKIEELLPYCDKLK